MSRIRFRRGGVSNGVTALKEELEQRGHDSKLLRNENSSFRPRQGDVILNWGNRGEYGLNCDTSRATNKTLCLEALQRASVPCPDFTTDQQQAAVWLDEDSSVVCRTLTRASSGRGLVIADSEEQLVNAPLYTRYIKKREEYRVHVFNEEVIDVQRKARRSAVEDEQVNWRVRTSDNGFVFVREGVELPEHVKLMCVDAVVACGLDFGAVDIVWNEHRDSYYVLEINTAPGLEGQTVSSYADAIEKYIGERN